MSIGIIYFNRNHLRKAHENHTLECKQKEICWSLKGRLAGFEQIFIVVLQDRAFFDEGKKDEFLRSFYVNIKSDLELSSDTEINLLGAPWDANPHFETLESACRYIIKDWEEHDVREELFTSKSHFSVLSFDSDCAKVFIRNFNYSSGMYHEKLNGSVPGDPNLKTCGKRKFSLSKEFSDHLDSLDDQFLKHGHERWKTDDISVDPYLKYEDPKTRKSGISRFNCLLESGKLDKAILIGDGGAGKTFLSKKLFKHFHSKGFTPLLVYGFEIIKPDTGYITDTLFRQAFENCFSSKEHAHFNELDKKSIVVIIDDFDGCRLRGKYRNQFIKNLNAQIEKVIFCSKALMFFNSTDTTELSSYQTFNLVEYSYKRVRSSIGK